MSDSPPQDYHTMLATYKQAIDADIGTYASHAATAASSQYGAGAAETTTAFLELVKSGGKRLRGTLTMLGYEMLGGQDRQMIVRAATAMEMIHAHLLVLDDIQDRATVRRGKPTLHTVLTASPLAQGDVHTGMSLAFNAALAGSHAAHMLLAGLSVEPELVRKVLGIINLTMVVTSHGQNHDLTLARPGSPLPTDQELENVMQWKTAEYTFLNPLCVGMVLAGAGCDDTNAIREYALHAGKAYQLENDIQGVFGGEAANGKDSGEDIREGKRTFLTVYALRHASAADQRFLADSLGSKVLTGAVLQRCRQIIKGTGALHHAEQLRDQYARAAIASLEAAGRPWTATHVRFLRRLATNCTSVTHIDKKV